VPSLRTGTWGSSGDPLSSKQSKSEALFVLNSGGSTSIVSPVEDSEWLVYQGCVMWTCPDGEPGGGTDDKPSLLIQHQYQGRGFQGL
jgi:hypothetical protein